MTRRKRYRHDRRLFVSGVKANTRFAARIDAIRLELGLTDAEFCERMLISKATLCNWRAGVTSPHVTPLEKGLKRLGYRIALEPVSEMSSNAD